MKDGPNQRIINALTPDYHSQAAYVGRVKQYETIVIHDLEGNPIQTEIEFYVSWDSFKAMLELVRQRAGV